MGWRAMLKSAREMPLWAKYPFGCPCTGLTVRIETLPEEEDGQ